MVSKKFNQVFFDNNKSVNVDELFDLKPLGTKKHKELVLFVADQSIDCYLAYYYLLKSNFAVIMIDAKIEKNALNEIMCRYQPNYLILPKVKIFNERNLKIISEYESYLFLDCNNQNLEINSTLKFLIPTSGTTGVQKFVKLSEQNIQVNTQDIIDYLSITDCDIAPTTLPLSYSYGMSVVNSHLHAGASIFINNLSLMERNFVSDLKNASVTNINGVPTFWEFAKRMRFFKSIPSTVRFVTQAGGHLSSKTVAELHETCIDRDILFYVMYGQTECSPRMSYLNVNQHPKKIGSIGRPINSGSFNLIKRKDILEKESGELSYKGPNVGMGYSTGWKDLNQKNKWNGEISTGDIAKVDSDGFYYITGRLKRICKIAGIRIDLDACQLQLKKATGVDNLAIVGNDDYLHIFSTETLNIDDLKKFMIINYAITSTKIVYTQLGQFPMNNGKISLRELGTMI